MSDEQGMRLKVRLKKQEFHLNVPDLLPDELTYSYLIRFGLSNGCPSVTIMMNLLRKAISRKRGEPVRKDALNTSVDDLFELGYDSFFSMTSTVFPLKFILDKELANMDLSKLKNKSNDFYMEPLRLCPQCAKEDLEGYGTCYYHRIHHIPGVTVCVHHGCALRLQNWDGDDICCQNGLTLSEASVECKVLPYAEEYAKFVEDLLDNVSAVKGICANDTVRIVKKRLDFIDLAGGDRPTQKELSLYSSGSYSQLGQIFRPGRALHPRTSLYAISRIFGSFEDFASEAKDLVAEKEFKASAEKIAESVPGYRFLEAESRNGFRYIKVRHEACGNIFWRGLSEFSTRTAECPCCRKLRNSPEGFRADFEREFGDRFVLESEYINGKTAVVVGIKGSEIKIRETPGRLMGRLRWLMEDDTEMKRLLETGVIRDRVGGKIQMAEYIESNFREDEPFLTSSLPPNPEMNNIMKGLCDNGKVHRIAPGLYSRTPISMTPDEIIDLRYIRSGSLVYGFDIGDRFLEEVMPGYLGDRSTRVIVTNSDRSVLYHKLEVSIGGIRCSVYRSNIHIDESNCKVLALIEFFRHEDACSLPVTEETVSILAVWATKNRITAEDIRTYSGLCTERTKNGIKRLLKEISRLCQEKQ